MEDFATKAQAFIDMIVAFFQKIGAIISALAPLLPMLTGALAAA